MRLRFQRQQAGAQMSKERADTGGPNLVGGTKESCLRSRHQDGACVVSPPVTIVFPRKPQYHCQVTHVRRDSESSRIPAAPPGGAAAWHPRPWPHLPERLRLSARRAPRQRGEWPACSPDRQLENTNKTEGKEINNKERARKPKKIQFPGSGKLGACSLARPRAFGTGTGALCAAFGHPLRAPS
ncbi:unnamed protein product [Rangifer tarandus platyrhynchus]|uniref:Uncharacterized protein n=3 Tax=Rangifer tarandus platyrhynchus TaxID=3082113 RepID=A0ACB0EYV4_RANTA|nr:unnamed protein product [Rangifer tarandus platyrhynchus]CAI9705314.1 unnamed protein product [Rangifer tarandus platyrhynchus]